MGIPAQVPMHDRPGGEQGNEKREKRESSKWNGGWRGGGIEAEVIVVNT